MPTLSTATLDMKPPAILPVGIYRSLKKRLIMPPPTALGRILVAQRFVCSNQLMGFILLTTHGGMARLSQPRATVCQFPAYRNYAVTIECPSRDSNSGLSPVTNPACYDGPTTLRYTLILH